MPVLHNDKPRLIWGPKARGYAAPQWLPGQNRLDAAYWDLVKGHGTIKRWLDLGFIRFEAGRDLPDPRKPPTPAELAAFSPSELSAALKNPDIPFAWHTFLEAELEKRGKVDPPGLTGMRVADALPAIAAETDIDKLIAWADADKRKSIGDAVDARLAELEGDGNVAG